MESRHCWWLFPAFASRGQEAIASEPDGVKSGLSFRIIHRYVFKHSARPGEFSSHISSGICGHRWLLHALSTINSGLEPSLAMKPLILLVAAAAVVDAHYIFNILIVNGKRIGGEYDYFRRNSNSYNPAFPADIINSTDLRCNHGAKANSRTKTYDVNAGDKIGFKLFNNEFIEHPGPGFVYMSKAPDSVATYEGDGDWFKAYEVGLCGKNPGSDGNWCSYQKDRLEFTIPPKIPPGEYLVRVEHIGLHEGHKNRAQFYIECTQLKISGPGGGTPAPLFKIPGIYSANDPGIHYDKWAARPAEYIMPGPALWKGE